MGIASELREGMHDLADAVRTFAGCMAAVAAARHANDYGAQRQMAAVIFEDAQSRFGDVHRKLDPKQRKELETFVTGLCSAKRK